LYKEGINSAEKFKDNEEKRKDKVSMFNEKIKLTQRFINVMNVATTDREQALKLCNEMLNLVKYFFI
jgi:hypothetical protein